MSRRDLWVLRGELARGFKSQLCQLLLERPQGQFTDVMLSKSAATKGDILCNAVHRKY